MLEAVEVESNVLEAVKAKHVEEEEEFDTTEAGRSFILWNNGGNREGLNILKYSLFTFTLIYIQNFLFYTDMFLCCHLSFCMNKSFSPKNNR